MSLKKMISLDLVDEIIDEARLSKSAELREAAEAYPAWSSTPQEVADTVDEALAQVSQALRSVLDGEDHDEKSEKDKWWQTYEPEPPHDWWKGGPSYDSPLPRSVSSASWWNE